jgi:hypothetical protein
MRGCLYLAAYHTSIILVPSVSSVSFLLPRQVLRWCWVPEPQGNYARVVPQPMDDDDDDDDADQRDENGADGDATSP